MPREKSSWETLMVGKAGDYLCVLEAKGLELVDSTESKVKHQPLG